MRRVLYSEIEICQPYDREFVKAFFQSWHKQKLCSKIYRKAPRPWRARSIRCNAGYVHPVSTPRPWRARSIPQKGVLPPPEEDVHKAEG